MPGPAAAVLPYLLIPLVLWRVYARIKRLMTRQQSHAWRHWLSVVLFSLIVLSFVVPGLAYPSALAALAVGVAAGAGLAIAAFQRTVFENEDGTLYYTPSAHIGVFVSLLFVGRICYRFLNLYLNHGASQPDQPWTSPVSMLVFGLLAGYYVVYSGSLLRWRRKNGIK
ncbi:MAG: hypothetical protein ACXU8N_05115 [Telluria sp.]